ncbi:unnamed protein product [Parajaminaea phylloscopi]
MPSTAHAHQPSVANAAALFGNSGDDGNQDPFAAIASSSSSFPSGLSAVAEQDPAGAAASSETGLPALGQDQSSASKSENNQSIAAEPPTDLFGGSSYAGNDDWLHGAGEGQISAGGEAEQAAPGPETWYGQNPAGESQWPQYENQGYTQSQDYAQYDGYTNQGSDYAAQALPTQPEYYGAGQAGQWDQSASQNSGMYDYSADPNAMSGQQQQYASYYDQSAYGQEQRGPYDYSQTGQPQSQGQYQGQWDQSQQYQNSGEGQYGYDPATVHGYPPATDGQQYQYTDQTYQHYAEAPSAEAANPVADSYQHDRYAANEAVSGQGQYSWDTSAQSSHYQYESYSEPPASHPPQMLPGDTAEYGQSAEQTPYTASYDPQLQAAPAQSAAETSPYAPATQYTPAGWGSDGGYDPVAAAPSNYAGGAQAAAMDTERSPSAALPPPPKGPARGPSRSSARSAQATASPYSPATNDLSSEYGQEGGASALASPTLQVNGFSSYEAETDPESVHDFEHQPTSFDAEEFAAMRPDVDEALAAPPRAERQPTPKLTLTGDDEETTELDTTISESGGTDAGVESYNDGQLDGEGSLGLEETSLGDDDLDEAAREFNELQLVGKTPVPSPRRRSSSRSSKTMSLKGDANSITSIPVASSSTSTPVASKAEGPEHLRDDRALEEDDPEAGANEAYDHNDAPNAQETGFEDQYGPVAAREGASEEHQAGSLYEQEAYDRYAPAEPSSCELTGHGPEGFGGAGQNVSSTDLAYAPPSDVNHADPYAPTSSNDAFAHAERQDSQHYGYEHDVRTVPSSQHEAYGSPYHASSQGSVYDPYAPQASTEPDTPSQDPYAPPHQYDPKAYAPQVSTEPDMPSPGPYGATHQYNQGAGEAPYGVDGGWGASANAIDNDVYGPAGAAYRDEDALDTPIAPRGRGHLLDGGDPTDANEDAYGQPSALRQPLHQSPYGPSSLTEDQYKPLGVSAENADYFAGGPMAPTSTYAASARGEGSVYTGDAPDPAEEKRNARIPLACFGIDGKLVTFFPNQGPASSEIGYGYAGGDASPPTKLSIRPLSTLIPPTSFASSFDPLKFPGPAFESTAAASAIVRATGAGAGISAATKAKKAALITYLKEAADQMDAGMSYRKRRGSVSASVAGEGYAQNEAKDIDDSTRRARKTEDRILLIRLLALILEHDGNITSNSTFDDAVRALLSTGGPEEAGGSSVFAPGFAPALGEPSRKDETITTHSVTSTHLKQIADMLATGQRREAVQYAMSQKLWAHAMVISSAVDQTTWREVVSQFVEEEIGSPQTSSQVHSSLKAAYGLFSGQDPSNVYSLFRPLGPGSDPDASETSKLPEWRTSARVIVANRCSSDSAALTAVGDGLLVGGWQEAAHLCYLLAPRTSPVGGADAADARMALLGAHNPMASSEFTQDLDHFILSEIYEFTFSLVPAAKNQEAFAGLPHLQAYRLAHAWQLVELGETKRAQKYCEAIAGVIKASKQSPYIHRALVNQVKELSDRLVGGPQLDSGGNWVTRKIQRPTLDGMLSAFEGRFTKFIAGDDDSAGPSSGAGSGFGALGRGKGGSTSGGGASAGQAVGAFSHFTAITPDATSGGISRVASFADFNSSSSRPASRAQSSTGFRNASSGGPSSFAYMQQQQQQQDRSATPIGSAYDPYAPSTANSTAGADWGSGRRSKSPSVASSAGFRRSDSAGPHHQHDSMPTSEMYGSPTAPSDVGSAAPWPGLSGPGTDLSETAYEGPSYGYDANSDVSGAPRPQFVSNLGGTLEDVGDGAGFVSPMDALGSSGPTYSPQAPVDDQPDRMRSRWQDEEDEDDLGFGNTSHKTKQSGDPDNRDNAGSSGQRGGDKGDQKDNARGASEDADKKPELKSTPSSSWLGRLWGRRESNDANTPKAKQAHMGEESAFYFDKDLKRWVNKKSGDSGGGAATPPPPPRATTASPSMASRRVPSEGPSDGPTRPSAATLGRVSSVDGMTAGGRPPPPAASSAFAAQSNSVRGTPPISEDGDGVSPSSPPSLGGRNAVTRTRSNLGDLSQPAAAQAPMRPSSATGMPPPPPPPSGPAGRAAGKKKPISSRYVRVD